MPDQFDAELMGIYSTTETKTKTTEKKTKN